MKREGEIKRIETLELNYFNFKIKINKKHHGELQDCQQHSINSVFPLLLDAHGTLIST